MGCTASRERDLGVVSGGAAAAAEVAAASPPPSPPHRTKPAPLRIFDLSDDLLVEVFSFLGPDPPAGRRPPSGPAPILDSPSAATPSSDEEDDEDEEDPPLTHVLPLVGGRFRALCRTSDGLWAAVLLRLLRSDPAGCEEAVRFLVDGGRAPAPPDSRASKRARPGEKSQPQAQPQPLQAPSPPVAFADPDLAPPWAEGGRDTDLWRFRVRYRHRSLARLVRADVGEEDRAALRYVGHLCLAMTDRHGRGADNGGMEEDQEEGVGAGGSAASVPSPSPPSAPARALRTYALLAGERRRRLMVQGSYFTFHRDGKLERQRLP